ncbi:MAG: hypothetical protein H6629_21270 [Calditrichae bacterium]|nr:hypothetical protein [Calditrichia bacterium]
MRHLTSLVWISGSMGKYAITNDGGENWVPGNVPGADSLDFRDVQVFDKNNALLLACGPGENPEFTKPQMAEKTGSAGLPIRIKTVFFVQWHFGMHKTASPLAIRLPENCC